MFRIAPLLLLAACAADPTTATDHSEVSLGFSREHVSADIYHYELVLPIGDTPNAALRIHRVVRERAPFVPRRTQRAAMLLHGDFSTFATNFLPGMAPYLAGRDIDVWGLDRRWTLATDDVSDFGDVGVAREVDDLRIALAFARAMRGSAHKLALVGFSHGAQLAYTYAAVGGGAAEHVDGLVALDFYRELEDAEMRTQFCDFAAFEYQLVADGTIDSPNDFLVAVGDLARTAPEDPSPFFDGMTNREAMLMLVGQTYFFVPFAPRYHLAAPILDGGAVTGLRESPEATIANWLASATPHQSMREAADFDQQLCGGGPQPVAAPVSAIRVPLLYVGAAGGAGALGIHTTTLVSSTDVTTMIVQRFGDDRQAEDFGHADLLYATDAPALAWQPIANWLVHH